MATDAVTEAHRRELLQRASPVYAVTAALEAARGVDQALRPKLREVAADLVEIVVLMDRKAGAGAESVLAAIVGLPAAGQLEALEAWRDAVEASSAGAAGLRRVLATPTDLLTGSDATRHQALVQGWRDLGQASVHLDDTTWATTFRIAAERSSGLAAGAILGAAAYAASYGHGDVPGLLTELAARLDGVSPTELPAYAGTLPRMCAGAKALGQAGLLALFDEIDALPEADARAEHLAFIAPYGEIDGDALAAVHALGRRAREIGRVDLTERMTAACAVETLLETTDGRRLLPSLGKLLKTTASADDRLFASEVTLVTDVARGHPSSAFELTQGLLGRLSELERARVADYVEDFGKLVEVMGLRPVGFGLGQLPKMYRRSPADARALVEAAVSIGRVDGPTAAQWFILGKTAAGKQALRKALGG